MNSWCIAPGDYWNAVDITWPVPRPLTTPSLLSRGEAEAQRSEVMLGGGVKAGAGPGARPGVLTAASLQGLAQPLWEALRLVSVTFCTAGNPWSSRCCLTLGLVCCARRWPHVFTLGIACVPASVMWALWGPHRLFPWWVCVRKRHQLRFCGAEEEGSKNTGVHV